MATKTLRSAGGVSLKESTLSMTAGAAELNYVVTAAGKDAFFTNDLLEAEARFADEVRQALR